MNVVEAEPAISFECAECGFHTYEGDQLERDDDYEGSAIESDVISCERCGVDHKVIRYI